MTLRAHGRLADQHDFAPFKCINLMRPINAEIGCLAIRLHSGEVTVPIVLKRGIVFVIY